MHTERRRCWRAAVFDLDVHGRWASCVLWGGVIWYTVGANTGQAFTAAAGASALPGVNPVDGLVGAYVDFPGLTACAP